MFEKGAGWGDLGGEEGAGEGVSITNAPHFPMPFPEYDVADNH
jgi:hypothetical protein